MRGDFLEEEDDFFYFFCISKLSVFYSAPIISKSFKILKKIEFYVNFNLTKLKSLF